MKSETNLTFENTEAPDSVDRLIARLGESPLALAEFARTFLLSKGQGTRARALCDRALALAPEDGEIQTIRAEVYSAGVGDWFFSMVRDEVRNAAFDRAIAKAVRGGARVLDIGSGTGLFAMMAARAGAAEVLSCERNEAVAEAARQIVARNGFAGRIRIVAKNSNEITVGDDLAEPADVLTWDNVGSDLISLGTLPALEDAARRLLKPEGLMIPSGASIHAALAEYARLPSWRMTSAAGFDLTPFNTLAQPVIPLHYDNPNLVVRSDAARLFEFALVPGARFTAERVSRMVTAAGGKANGLVHWIEFKLDDDEAYSAGPGAAHSAFALHFRPTPEPFETATGQVFAVYACHDREHLRVWLGGPR